MKRKLLNWIKENCFPIHESYVIIWALGSFLGTMFADTGIKSANGFSWIEFTAEFTVFVLFLIPAMIFSFYSISYMTEKFFEINRDDVCVIKMDGTQLNWEDEEVTE